MMTWRPPINDPVSIDADDSRILCQACNKEIGTVEFGSGNGFYCEHCNHDLFDEDIF